MNRRTFAKRTALTLPVLLLTSTAFKCGSEQVSIYIRTVVTFLNQISTLLPDRAAMITKIVKIASDFDAAYKRGDFDSADTFFNSLEQNLSALTASIGVNTSNTVKTWIAIIGATVTSIAVLFKEQVEALPAITKAAVRAELRAARSAGAVERLASQAAVDALYQTAKP
jgi:hypothetical protein